jgi:hypothetical protein
VSCPATPKYFKIDINNSFTTDLVARRDLLEDEHLLQPRVEPKLVDAGLKICRKAVPYDLRVIPDVGIMVREDQTVFSILWRKPAL